MELAGHRLAVSTDLSGPPEIAWSRRDEGWTGWRTRLYGSEDVRVFILPHALLLYSPDGRNPRRRHQ